MCGVKNIGVHFFIFWGSNFILGAGAPKNWGSNLVYFGDNIFIFGVEYLGSPKNWGSNYFLGGVKKNWAPIFSFWVQENWWSNFFGGGVQKIGSNFHGWSDFLFLGSKKIGGPMI